MPESTSTSTTTISTLPVEIDGTKVEELTLRGTKARAWAEAIVIASQPQADSAWEATKVCRQRIQEAIELTEPARKKADEAKQAVLAIRNRLVEPYEIANRILTPKIASWQAEQDRRAREEQAHAQEAARKAEEDRRLAEAAALEAEGRQDEAAALIDAPLEVPAVPAPLPTKLADGALGKTWEAEVHDLKAVVAHLAQMPGLVEALAGDAAFLKALNTSLSRMARALKGALKIPGVRVTEKPVLRRTGGRKDADGE